MKFDNKPMDVNWENIEIEDKWAPVFIESPKRISKKDRFEILMRKDDVFYGGRCAGGNDHIFLNALWDYINVPEDYDEKRTDAWKKRWKSFGDYSDETVLNVDLISSCYIGGPNAFFDWKTGKVASTHNIGKYVGNIGECKEELEAFAEAFPQLDLYITFGDGTEDTRGLDTVCTLRLHDGIIDAVKIRTPEQVEHCIPKKKKYIFGRLYINILKYIYKHSKKLSRFTKYYEEDILHNREEYFSKKDVFYFAYLWKEMLYLDQK